MKLKNITNEKFIDYGKFFERYVLSEKGSLVAFSRIKHKIKATHSFLVRLIDRVFFRPLDKTLECAVDKNAVTITYLCSFVFQPLLYLLVNFLRMKFMLLLNCQSSKTMDRILEWILEHLF